jgi:hypothetical protein
MTINWIPDIEAPAANIVGRKWFKDPGQFPVVAPAGAKFGLVRGQGVGAQGASWGGGGAFSRRKFPCVAGEAFTAQVGINSSGSTPGDTGFWRGAAYSTDVLMYADRGRGAGPGGSAALSIGDVKRDGKPGQPSIGQGGDPAGDALDLDGMGFNGSRAIYNTRGGDPGGGGTLLPMFDEYGNFIGYTAATAGQGVLCVEWFDADPG